MPVPILLAGVPTPITFPFLHPLSPPSHPMQTTLRDAGATERELEVEAPAEELEDDLQQALQAQQKQADMKGFRKGKVPLSLIKKMYGQQLGLQVAQRAVQEAFEQEVEENEDAPDVLGRPEITELDYEPESDLHAVVRFGVRPEIELKDLSGEELPKLVPEVSAEDVEREELSLRKSEATLLPTDEAAGETDYIVFDLQELDTDSGTPIVGNKEEEQELFLDSPQVEGNPMLEALKDAVAGAHAGESVQFTIGHGQAHGGGGEHAHRFEVTLKDVKKRELPELTDEFVRDATDGEFESVEDFRAQIRERLAEAWQQRADEALQREIVQRMRELHPASVPPDVVETFLDSFVEDVKRRNDDELPEDFDETVFREKNRSEAQEQAHWMLLRDEVVDAYDLEATDADIDAFFEKQAAQTPELEADQLKRFYESQEEAMDQVRQQVLSEKVFDTLEEQFQINEKDRETFEQEMKARQPAAPTAEGAAPPEEADSGEDSPLIVT
ncbi:MAG: trigger factor [Bacteroidetes bacterium QS_8_68_15]|nr:MAG: trigger factor [Bacteroidetes bacterium QS_8_68_15]